MEVQWKLSFTTTEFYDQLFSYGNDSMHQSFHVSINLCFATTCHYDQNLSGTKGGRSWQEPLFMGSRSSTKARYCIQNRQYYKELNISQLSPMVHHIEVTCFMSMSWPENQGILFFYISKTLEMIRISFMASLLNAVL